MLVEGFQAGLHSGQNVARKVEFDWNKVSHSNRVDHTTIHWNRFTLQEKRDVLVWAGQTGGPGPGPGRQRNIQRRASAVAGQYYSLHQKI